MMDALSIYGPDGNCSWRVGPIGLGHQMMYLTPESLTEKLPYHDSVTGLTITADARLDNRDDLLGMLCPHRPDAHALPDSQIILRAYEKWGEDCPRYLLGDFTFAIWKKHGQSLFVARDHMGIRPLYYYLAPGLAVCGTSIRSVLSISDVPDDLDENYVFAFLIELHFSHLERTFYRGVKKLPPGHCLTVTQATSRLRAYWSPADSPTVSLSDEEEYVARLRELIQDAVRARLRCVYPIGSHLSGGLDSSSVAVLAHRFLRRKDKTLHTYSWSAPPATQDFPLMDDRQFVEAVTEQEGLKVLYCTARLEDLIELFRRDVTREPTEPVAQECMVRQHARSQNIRLLLSGWGGDELVGFNGRGYYAELFLRGKWFSLVRELRMRAKNYGDSPWWMNLYRRVAVPILPDCVVTVLHPKTHKSTYPTFLPSQWIQEYRSQQGFGKEFPRVRPGVRKQQLRLLNNAHLVHRVEAWNDEGVANGVQYAYPLLDKRIVQFSLGIPSSLFSHQGWQRYLFRTAMDGVLPQSVRWNTVKYEPVRPRNGELMERAICALGLKMAESSVEATFLNMIDKKELSELIFKHQWTSDSGRKQINHSLALMRAAWLLASVGRRQPI